MAKIVNMMDPLWKYPEMMSVNDICEFAQIGRTAASNFIQRHGGVKLDGTGTARSSWRIHKEYVRRFFNVPSIPGGNEVG